MASAVFTSAELHRRGDRQDEEGDILTWVSANGGFQAVDQQARTKSSWPPAAVGVRATAARSSRACVVEYRTQSTSTTTNR